MKKHSYPGKLIVAEGLDGSGKTTQLNLMKSWLEVDGYAAEVFKRKASQLVANSIVEAKAERRLTPITYSLIHAADFSDLLHRRVIPALKAGFVVLFNKYVYTSLAKDALRGQDKDWILKLYDFAIQPDAVFYFRTKLEYALERMTQEEKEKDFYDSGMDIGFGSNSFVSMKNYQAKLLEQYELMTRLYNFEVIDAAKSIHSQQDQIRKYMKLVLS